MTYYEEVKRFRQSSHIQDAWCHEEVYDGKTLEDVADERLTKRVTQTQKRDPDTNTVQQVSEAEPWTMTPQQALDVCDQLDKCANLLGFDAEPKNQKIVTGAGEAADDPDDVNHLNTNPLEAVNGDD
jgi:hypothetical protein